MASNNCQWLNEKNVHLKNVMAVNENETISALSAHVANLIKQLEKFRSFHFNSNSSLSNVSYVCCEYVAIITIVQIVK